MNAYLVKGERRSSSLSIPELRRVTELMEGICGHPGAEMTTIGSGLNVVDYCQSLTSTRLSLVFDSGRPAFLRGGRVTICTFCIFIYCTRDGRNRLHKWMKHL